MFSNNTQKMKLPWETPSGMVRKSSESKRYFIDSLGWWMSDECWDNRGSEARRGIMTIRPYKAPYSTHMHSCSAVRLNLANYNSEKTKTFVFQQTPSKIPNSLVTTEALNVLWMLPRSNLSIPQKTDRHSNLTSFLPEHKTESTFLTKWYIYFITVLFSCISKP